MNKCPNCGVGNADGAQFCLNCGKEFSPLPAHTLDSDGLFRSELDPIKEKLVEKYQILRFIGKGGFSTVFLLKDKVLERPCALKILARDLTMDMEMVERFKREARLYASLDHPNIVSVYDFGFHNHVAYIIFKYIDGVTLHDYIQRHLPLAQAEILAIASDLVGILNHLHQRGIIHRDIKPDNVMIQNGDRKVILTDFGLAKKLDSTNMTSTGRVMGSPYYFSPEQAKGEAVDVRTDIYSLGITIYEMVSGIVPFKGDTPYQVILKHINEPMPDPARARADLHPELQRLILKCTEKDPRRRFQTMAELELDLKKISIEGREAKTVIIEGRRRGRVAKRPHVRPAFAVAAVLALALAALYFFMVSGAKRPVPAARAVPDQASVMNEARYVSLLREARELLAKGDFLPAGQKAAAARTLKVGKEVDELDEQIRVQSAAEKKKQADRQQGPAQPPGPDKAGADKKPGVQKMAAVPENRAKPISQEQAPAKPASKKSAADEKPSVAASQLDDSAKSKPAEAARIIDLPVALCQQYIRELGLISVAPLAAGIRVNGTITLVLRIGQAGNVSLESANDGDVKIEPESQRAEILDLIKTCINGIKVQPPVNKTGAAVRIENWRIAFRIGRDQQRLVLSRIN
ncbi:MAG: protein kinase [Candidatus Aminicenantes bacterium]|nr:protein kinase [Candidatus Aminicenantes bacterium]